MLSSELSELNRVIKDLSGGGHHDTIRAERLGATTGEAEMDQLLLDSPDATPSKGMLGDSLSSRASRLPGETPGASVSDNTPFSPTSELERAAQQRHGGGRVVDRQYDGAPAGAVTTAQAAPQQRTKVITFDQKSAANAGRAAQAAEPITGAAMRDNAPENAGYRARGAGAGAGVEDGVGANPRPSAAGANSPTPATAVPAAQSADIFDFAVEAVPTIPVRRGSQPPPMGGLSKALSEDSAPGGDSHKDVPKITLAIYLPSREEMSVEVFDVSTVEDAITTALLHHKKMALQPALYYGHTDCYELRMHEGDGYPDEDFPALNRKQLMRDFGTAGGNEYCLCERPGKCPPPNFSADGSGGLKSISARRKSETGHSFIKIKMLNSTHTVLPLSAETTGKDLLPLLAKKHRLQLFTGEYVFRLKPADQQRLKMPTAANGEVDMEQPLQPLDLEEVELAPKTYADSPQLPLPRKQSAVARLGSLDEGADAFGSDAGGRGQSGGGGSNVNVRPELDSFMYNDMTASQYKEWNVIKTNKFGKKQQRVMGVDLTKIYNYNKAGRSALRRNSTVRTPERLISEIKSIRYLDNPTEFEIVFREGGGDGTITLAYATKTALECAEIVSKIKYILSRQSQQTQRA